jgi:hypothetical protein
VTGHRHHRFVGDAFQDVSTAIAGVAPLFRNGGLPLLPNPPILSASLWRLIVDAGAAVHRGLLAVHHAHRAQALAWPHTHPSWLPVPPSAAPLRSYRLDALIDPMFETVHFVEAQAGDPSGIGWVDVLQQLVTNHYPACHSDARAPTMIDGLLSVMDDDARLATGRPAYHIVGLCRDDSIVATDHDAVAWLLRARGRQAKRRWLPDLQCHGGRVWVDGQPVDAILRDTLDDMVDTERDHASAVFGSMVGVRNPIGDAQFDDKRCFAHLRNPVVQQQLDAETRTLIAKVVPETVAIDDDNRSWLLEQQPHWVIKPADGYGGHDVLLGDCVAPSTFARALADEQRPWVAQRRVVCPAQPWPTWSHDGSMQSRFVTFSFWLFDGVVTAGFVRAGGGPVVNVHQGGGIGPIWISNA